MEAARGDSTIRPDHILRGAPRDPEGRLRPLVRFQALVDEDAEREGHVRVVDPRDLGHWIEVPRNQVLFWWPEDPDLTPSQGTSLWIERDAVCRHRPVEGQPDALLAGAIADLGYGIALEPALADCPGGPFTHWSRHSG
jgi:hypothetical protein